MLPFLKRSKDASVSMPVESIERKPDEDKEPEFDGLETAMKELHSALTAGDYKTAGECFRSAFDLLETQPHDEIGHKE